jgi:CHAT domain-containing protein
MALTILLRRKGRVLDAINDSLGQVRRNLKPQDQALLNELIGTRVRLATDTIKGPGKLRVEEHRSNLRQLDERVDQLEGELSARSAEFRTQSQLITLGAVQKAIPAGAVLVEFASYHPYDARSGKYASSRYVAYTLAARGEPHWVELGAVGPIEKVVGSLRAALRDPKRRDVKQLSRALDAKVMQPVRRLIGQNKWLLISPDGALNLIPFSALVDENSQYLVKKYLFTYLTSGRDLLRLQVQIANKQPPLVIANPDFGGTRPSREDAKVKPILTTEASLEATPASLFSRFYFPPLPGTASEGEALRGILPNVTLLTQRQATKTAVEQVDGPKILHIATHGFFLENFETGLSDTRTLQLLTADPARVLLQKGVGGIAGLHVENPLLRSGLALAGANEHKSDDNGILTAVEVAGLSLWGTKLVVLSACDTGVGEVRNGDGVYGLRRALVLAGSESQIMSLWPVNDAATRDLMIEYYKAIQAGQGRSEALRHVQLKMLNDPKHNHPAYWASFIQSGAWSPLQ